MRIEIDGWRVGEIIARPIATVAIAALRVKDLVLNEASPHRCR